MSNRFGLDIPAAAGVDPVAAARTAEELGYDFVSTSDHPSGTAPSNETWTMLTWIAAHTSRIEVMPRVLGVPYRNPAMVAKMAETLDRLAGGRLILGLGGGASDEEFRAFGIPVPPPRDKVDGLADAIRIIRGLWVEPAFTYTGRIHRVVEAPLEPKPARRIPIWVGTFGPRALDVTGRLADGWMPSLGYAPLDRLPGMLARIGAAAEAAGRSPSDVTCALNVEVSVGAERAGAVSGPADLVAGRLRALLAMGFTVLNLKLAGPDRREQGERLALEVLPAVRS